MPLPTYPSSTGDAPLPAVGELFYNGVTFSCLFHTNIRGSAVEDAASRTVRYMEYTLEVEGVVTISTSFQSPSGDSIDSVMDNLRNLLSQQAGQLSYTAKGFGDFRINPPGGGGLRDVAWGPVPKVIAFTPLGASRSAMVTWTVTTRIPEQRGASLRTNQAGGGGFSLRTDAGGARVGANVAAAAQGGALPLPLVQFNWDSNLTYDDEGYATVSFKGVMEIPMTRISVGNRSVSATVDDYRQIYLDWLPDLTRWRVARRVFNVSRDKRTMTFDFQYEELPPMGLPPGATNARGNFSVRPQQAIPGNVIWVATLNCTYTIRKDFDRRAAWIAFMFLLRARQASAGFGFLPGAERKAVQDQQPPPPQENGSIFGRAVRTFLSAPLATLDLIQSSRPALTRQQQTLRDKLTRGRAFTFYYGFQEGIYLDSKHVSFECSWYFLTALDYLLTASGFSQQSGWEGGVAWGRSVADIMGWRSMEIARLNPAQDAIIDLGI